MTTVAAVALALLAALLAAVGTIVRNQATRGSRPGRGWAVGAVLSLGGFAAQIAALALGTVLLVQPIVVLSVLFELLLQVAWTRRRATARQWVCGIMVAGGVALFVLGARPRPAPGGRQTWVVDLAVSGILAALLVLFVLARKAEARRAGLLFGIVAGSLFGVVAVQVNTLSQPFPGVRSTLSDPTLLLCVATALVAVAAQQRALSRGTLETTYPAMVSAEPVVSVVLSLAVLGEQLSPDQLGTWVGLAGIAVMVVGVAGLARANALVTVCADSPAPRTID